MVVVLVGMGDGGFHPPSSCQGQQQPHEVMMMQQ